MIPPIHVLRSRLQAIVKDKANQGHTVDGLAEQIRDLPESYDAMVAMAQRLADLPMRADWRFVEPNALDDIWAECPADRPVQPIARFDPGGIAPRVEAAFYGSVCGCILGKPLEIQPDLAQIRKAAEAVGEWPLRDYIPVKLLDALGKRHDSWQATTRENIRFAAADDDINYSVAGMVLLEAHGRGFTRKDIADLWFRGFAAGWQWGPERTAAINQALASLAGPLGRDDEPWTRWVSILNPGDEMCGALIRADAYGYACPGHPALAAELAWRDAGYTHRRTGIYGTMFTAAAIAAAFVADEPLDIFEIALKYIPQRSRFAEVVRDSLAMVRSASDWLDGYQRVHNKYRAYGHCLVYQEIGTVINTLRFAQDVGDGICIQVSQGNDTDSFGATAGSILGAYFGPGHLEERWIRPFNDTLHTTLATFHEQRLSEVARRMGRLPARLARDPIVSA